MPSPRFLRRALSACCVVALAAPVGAHAQVHVTGGINDGTLQVVVDDPSSDVTLTNDAFDTIVTATVPIVADGRCSTSPNTPMTADCNPTLAFTNVAYTGGPGADVLHVTPGFPLLVFADGGPGDDQLSGADEPDVITGGAGIDTIDAGAGNDSIDTADGRKDGSVTCGAGSDTLFADNFLDPLDTATCETVAPEFAAGDPRILPADAVQGQTLTAATAPSGTSSLVLLQWLRCGPTGDLATCASIDGAIATTYTLTAGDVGSTIRVGAEASNAAGFDQSASGPTAIVRGLPAPIVVPQPPVTTTPPASPLSGRVARARCAGRICRITLALGGAVTRARVDLRHGARRLARVTRQVRTTRITLTLRAHRRLARGRYTIAVRLTGPGARPLVFRRTVRIR